MDVHAGLLDIPGNQATVFLGAETLMRYRVHWNVRGRDAWCFFPASGATEHYEPLMLDGC